LAYATWGRGPAGGKTQTWVQETEEIVRLWGLDKGTMKTLALDGWRKLVAKHARKAAAAVVDTERKKSHRVDFYLSVDPDRAKCQNKVCSYLQGGGHLSKGLQLFFQCRTGSLPVREVVTDGRKRGRVQEDAEDSDPEKCPMCQQQTESIVHLVLECEQYAALRKPLADLLEEALSEEGRSHYAAAGGSTQLQCLLTVDNSWFRKDRAVEVLQVFARTLWKIWEQRQTWLKEQGGA
jgi:hypothetical protein